MKGILPTPDWHIVYRDGEVWYYCNEEIVFNSHKGSPIVIPPRFLHNGGSIPWIFTKGLKKNGQMLSAYALHDYTYRKDFPHKITRKHADRLLYEYGGYLKYPKCKLRAVYAGVTIGGGRSWKKHNASFHALNMFQPCK